MGHGTSRYPPSRRNPHQRPGMGARRPHLARRAAQGTGSRCARRDDRRADRTASRAGSEPACAAAMRGDCDLNRRAGPSLPSRRSLEKKAQLEGWARRAAGGEGAAARGVHFGNDTISLRFRLSVTINWRDASAPSQWPARHSVRQTGGAGPSPQDFPRARR